MIPPAFDYAAPQTLQEAVALLGQNPEAKILAGGHSLIPMMRFRLATPAMLVDLNRIDGLSYIREEEGWLKIGAMAREVDLERSELIQQKYPLLAETTRMVADPLVRNLATIGGNLAHADPANDHPAAMLALGAQVVASGPNGARTIPVADLFAGPFETTLARDEILTEIQAPAAQPRSGGAYAKMERKVGDFATAAVAAQVTLDAQGKYTYAGLGLTNVGLTPIRAAAAEQALLGQAAGDDAIRQAAELAAQAADPGADYRGSVEYKRGLVKTLAVRALRRATAWAKGG
jgi:carbon-monoxide dehydrogenase medium subunit